MAEIQATSLGTAATTSAAAIYGVPLLRAPGANTLVLVGINHTDTAPENIASGVSGAGMVFSLLTQQPFNTTASNVNRMEIWGGMSASPINSRISVNVADSGTGCDIIVTEFSGVSTSGVSGANACRVSGTTGLAAQSASTTFLTSASSWRNAFFVISGYAANSTADVPDSNFQKLDACAYTTPAAGLASGWTSNSAVTQCVWSGGGNVARGALAIEIVANNLVHAASDDILIRFGPKQSDTDHSGLVTSLFSATGGGGGGGGGDVFSPFYYNMMQEWFSSV